MLVCMTKPQFTIDNLSTTRKYILDKEVFHVVEDRLYSSVGLIINT